MDKDERARLRWVQLYQSTENISLVCRRCGISRPTLYKWIRRFKAHGLEGLKSNSRAPLNSPSRKVGSQEEKWILDLRKERNLGARRIQNELKRNHECSLSLDTIHKVLSKHSVKPIVRLKRKSIKRYERPIPGDRVQMDTCKIRDRLYQYTAVDDCTRYRVLAVYPRRTAENTIHFLEKLIDEMPFPVQRIQTDRGREFFAVKVQEMYSYYCIKFRPNRPGAPHLNGKVERSQKTDLQEFYATLEWPCNDLEDRLQEWQHHYNWHRPHGGLKGKTPMDRYFELIHDTPFNEDVAALYDDSKERIRNPNYQQDKKLAQLLKCK